ncbi:MAG TPA: hypothetical protein PKY66_10965, partial [Thermoflexales bacterium]|nr:hypothetical protein [Thermoflexales bacterium]
PPARRTPGRGFLLSGEWIELILKTTGEITIPALRAGMVISPRIFRMASIHQVMIAVYGVE